MFKRGPAHQNVEKLQMFCNRPFQVEKRWFTEPESVIQIRTMLCLNMTDILLSECFYLQLPSYICPLKDQMLSMKLNHSMFTCSQVNFSLAERYVQKKNYSQLFYWWLQEQETSRQQWDNISVFVIYTHQHILKLPELEAWGFKAPKAVSFPPCILNTRGRDCRNWD